MEINVAVIEDNDEAFESVKKCLARYSDKSEYTFNITRFVYSECFLENYKPIFDIVVMDIMLPGMDGMAAASKLRTFDPKVILIFVTNMSQFALKGYEVDALDYVLKPINYNSFSMRIDKALRRLDKPGQEVLLKFRIDKGVRLIKTADIYFIDILLHYITIHTNQEKISGYGVLSYIEKQLPETFVRCSACSIVNIKEVEGIYDDEVKLKNGEMIHIGRTKKKDFMTSLSKYIVGGRL